MGKTYNIAAQIKRRDAAGSHITTEYTTLKQRAEMLENERNQHRLDQMMQETIELEKSLRGNPEARPVVFLCGSRTGSTQALIKALAESDIVVIGGPERTLTLEERFGQMVIGLAYDDSKKNEPQGPAQHSSKKPRSGVMGAIKGKGRR